jgi:hypothetical protein
MTWFPSPHLLSLPNQPEDHSTPSRLPTLLLVTATTDCLCVWAIRNFSNESRYCDSLLCPSLPIAKISLSLVFDSLRAVEAEEASTADTDLGIDRNRSFNVTSLCAISNSSVGSIVFGLSNGTVIRVDIELEGHGDWDVIWYRNVFDSSIDGIELAEDQSKKLFIWSGQVCTLIVFDRIRTPVPPIISEGLTLSFDACLWKRSIMSYDVISSITIVNIPQRLDLHLLEMMEGIDSLPFPKDCRVFAIVTSLDGTVVCLPCQDGVSESHRRLVLFSTPFQVFGLSVDPLGFSYSFLINSNESSTKRYHQAVANHLHFRSLPWCPVSSVNHLKYLESVLWSIVGDPTKGYCSLSSLYLLVAQAVLEIEPNELDYSRKEDAPADDGM